MPIQHGGQHEEHSAPSIRRRCDVYRQRGFDLVCDYRWRRSSNGYAVRSGDNMGMHRLICGLEKRDGKVVDHINHNPLDNRRANLRVCTHGENLRNRCKWTSPSGFLVVTWSKSKQRWRARIIHESKEIFLGHFDDPVEAVRAYAEKALELYGEFANPAVIALAYNTPTQAELAAKKAA